MDVINKREMILKGNLYRVILTLSAPVMLSNLIQTFYNLTDTYFVSRLGTTELAAIQFAWPLIFLIVSLGTGLSMAAATLIAQYVGSNQYKEASKVAGQLIYFSLVFSILVGITGYILAPHIIGWMGGTGQLAYFSIQFLRIMFLGSFSHFLLFAFISIKQGQGDMKTPMKLSGLSVLTNMILDPIFIFTFGLGIPGAAYATILSRTIFALYGIYYLVYKDDGISINFNQFRFDKIVLKKLISIGLPTALGQSMTAIGFAVLNVFIISFGEEIMTAFAIGNRLSSLVFLPAMGVGTAIATIIGQNLGAENIERAKETTYKSFILITIITVIAGGSLLYFTDHLIRIFSSDPYIIAQGSIYMKLTLLTLPLIGYFHIFLGVFIGSGHTLQSMFMMIGRLWLLRIPMILIFKNYTNLGPHSVWYGMILSNFVIVIIGYIVFLSGRWQKKIIKKAFA